MIIFWLISIFVVIVLFIGWLADKLNNYHDNSIKKNKDSHYFEPDLTMSDRNNEGRDELYKDDIWSL